MRKIHAKTSTFPNFTVYSPLWCPRGGGLLNGTRAYNGRVSCPHSFGLYRESRDGSACQTLFKRVPKSFRQVDDVLCAHWYKHTHSFTAAGFRGWNSTRWQWNNFHRFAKLSGNCVLCLRDVVPMLEQVENKLTHKFANTQKSKVIEILDNTHKLTKSLNLTNLTNY